MATHTIVTIAGSLRKESFSLKIPHALAKLAPASLKLEVITPHGISNFSQDEEAAPPGRLARVPGKAAEVARRPVRDAGI
jgi:chromate reductase